MDNPQIPLSGDVTERIEIKERTASTIAGALFLCCITLGGFYGIVHSLWFLFYMLNITHPNVTTEKILTMTAAELLPAILVTAAGLAALPIFVRMLRRPVGRVDIRQDGIGFDDILFRGQVRWNEVENVGKVRKTRLFGRSGIGIKLKDPVHFVSTAAKPISAFEKAAMPLAAKALSNNKWPVWKQFLNASGLSSPDSFEASAFMRWMRDQTGFDYLIPLKSLVTPDQTLAIMQRLLTTQPATT